MVAVWPGMGQVALAAGYYMLAKLQMYLVAEFSPRELFEVQHVEVKGGLIRTGSLPRSRFFVWKDPENVRDLVLFIGDAQPETGKYAFCSKLLEFVKQLGVERVFTFAAMATPMELGQEPRVFGAATDQEGLDELKRLELDVLEDGNISGLNGVLLGVAAERGLKGVCLLGEMPHVFVQFPFPRAAHRVLQAFFTIVGRSIDLNELAEQAANVEKQLSGVLEQIRALQAGEEQEQEEEESFIAEAEEPEGLSDAEQENIDRLFRLARQDRSKAYELKAELDRLNAFKEYEDRFLDLFKKSE
jgi:proteasome assembly chaperone (PAC2) family protein